MKYLSKDWKHVTAAGLTDSTRELVFSGWALKYTRTLTVLEQHGCGDPPPELRDLDQAVTEASDAIRRGYYLGDYTSAVATALNQASEGLGVTSNAEQASSCGELTSGVRASFTLLSESTEGGGQDLWPKVTVTNDGQATVVVSLDGQGRASSEYGGGPMEMSWGGYTDSQLTVRPGETRSMQLGHDTDETLLVGNGQHLLSAKMRATADSDDGRLTGCRVRVSSRG